MPELVIAVLPRNSINNIMLIIKKLNVIEL